MPDCAEKEIVTRAEAKARGLKRYFTGKPCRHGHVAERWVVYCTCVTCGGDANKAWHNANKERNAANKKAWRETNKERKDAIDKAWYEANKERKAAYMKARYEANKERLTAATRAWRKANKERHAAYMKAWNKANSDARNVINRNRRARERSAEGTHTKAELQALRAKQGNMCAGCLRCLKHIKSHVDHIMPLALGGTNDIDNLQYLCARCNLSKGKKHPDVWRREMREFALKRVLQYRYVRAKQFSYTGSSVAH